MIQAHNLSKKYGRVQALNDVSLSVNEKGIFALLGPNGAGKTTFVKILMGLVQADKGEVSIQGIKSNSEKSRLGVGFLPEKFSFYPYYSVQGTLEFFALAHGVNSSEISDQINESLKLLGIDDLLKRKLKTLSKGQLQRVGIANMILGNKKLLIMDEPFSGLDPIGIKELKELLVKLKEEGKTIFLNSHILSEMEQICDQIALLNKGTCLAFGDIKSLVGENKLEDYFYEMVKKRN